MAKALILGIGGNFGSQMAVALKQQGWSVRALLRNKPRASACLHNVEQFIGNAYSKDSILKAADGVDLIIYAVNPAYQRWHIDALALLEPTVMVAKHLGVRLLFPGNVYNFSPTESLIDESQPMIPVTQKGEIRIAMEACLRQACDQGAKVTIVRAGDFIGPNTRLTWLDRTLKQTDNEIKMSFMHDDQHVHFWSYLPDLCSNAVSLLEHEQSSFEVWHDPGVSLTVEDWQQAFRTTGKQVTTSYFKWWGFQLIAPISPVLREVLKMRYLWQEELILDGAKMKQALGLQYQSTPLNKILEAIR